MDEPVEGLRDFYARLVTQGSRAADPRIERAFALVPREAFLGPGPWRVMTRSGYLDTPNSDLHFVYQNTLIALDADKLINNGEPSLHAHWMAVVAPKPGETVTHIGAGSGYYSAILSILVIPGGRVFAFEIEPKLAAAARRCLAAYEAVTVRPEDAVNAELERSEVIYVNAAVACPPVRWLDALKPGGRLIFPWQPSPKVSVALLVTRTAVGFAARAEGQCVFIPCAGATDQTGMTLMPSGNAKAKQVASLHCSSERPPDDSAIAIGKDAWFSSAPPG